MRARTQDRTQRPTAHRDAARSDARIEAAGGRSTPLRAWVVGALAEAGRPLTAYELISLRERETGRPVGPPSIYRVLEFLEGLGIVDRLVSQNAFVLCAGGEHESGAAFYLCRRCGSAEEVSDPKLARLLTSHAAELGFAPERRTVEVEGTCRTCYDEKGREEKR